MKCACLAALYCEGLIKPNTYGVHAELQPSSSRQQHRNDRHKRGCECNNVYDHDQHSPLRMVSKRGGAITLLPERTRNNQRWRKCVLSADLVQIVSISVQDFCHCPASCIQSWTGFVAPI
jgi:hypothetical protein